MTAITRVSSGRPYASSWLYTQRLVKRHTFSLALVLCVIFFLINSAETSWNIGLTQQLTNLAPTAIAAMASAPAIISGRGGFDLSISPVMVLASSVYVAWLVPHRIDGAGAIVLMLLAGGLIGLINGVLIVALRIPPIVTTLAMYFMLLGFDLALLPSPISVQNSPLADFANDFGPIPGPLVLLLFPLAVWGLLGLMPYRSMLLTVGSSDIAAYSAGIKVGLVRASAYALGGFLAGAGGVAIIAATSSSNASLAGTYALPGIAAVALGGTSLFGGRGGLFGPLLGAAAIFELSNILVAVNANPSWLQIMYGLMLVAAVVFVTSANRTTGATR